MIYGPRNLERMDRIDRIRACYQHCALKGGMSEPMVNQLLRMRIGLEREHFSKRNNEILLRE